MSIKGYTTNTGGKKHPIHNKKGITDKQMYFKTSDTIKVKNQTVKLRKKGKDELISVDSGHGIHNKIIIKNGIISPNNSILDAIVSIWSDIPNDVKKTVKRIEIRETKGPYSGTWYPKTKVLALNLKESDSEEQIENTLSHELGHADFQNMEDKAKTDAVMKEKLKKYIDALVLLPPITFYSKSFYDKWVKSENDLNQRKEFGSKEMVAETYPITLRNAHNYVNEEHAETAMYIASKNKDSLGVIYPPAMNEAVKDFKKLHSDK